MSIVDDLVENLVERNSFKLHGAVTVGLVDGGIKLRGRLFSTMRDQKKNKDVLKVEIPFHAEVRVGDVVIPLPQIK